MRKTNQTKLPNVGRFLTTLRIAWASVVLGLLCSLPVERASAQPCTLCPADATDTAIGTAFGVFVIRNGVQVTLSSGAPVGACETVHFTENVQYAAVGSAGGIGAGFSGGTGHLLLTRRGSVPVLELIADVTPADMATTVVGPASCIGAVFSKSMNPSEYRITAADVTAGFLQFTFEYTNGLSQLPNPVSGQCLDHVEASPQRNITVVAGPTCSIAPASQTICAGESATFTATANGSNVTYCWRKGCPNGAGACLSTASTLVINNARTSDAGCYELTVTDQFGCTSTCQATLIVNECAPSIVVVKDVACATANGCADATGYAQSATGVRGGNNNCPGFCYRIVVTNPATKADGSVNNVPLENITLSDPSLNLTACNAALVGVVLQPGQSATPCITGPVEHCTDFVNTVTARGVSATDHTSSTQATDTAEVHVVPISVACVILLHSDFDQDANNGGADGSANDNHVTLPASGTVQVSLTVTNSGEADLSVAISGLPCSVDSSGTPIPAVVPIASHTSVTFVCDVDVSCPGGLGITVTVTGTAVASTAVPCIYNVRGEAITTAASTCSASVNCVSPVTCRVTGGGDLYNGDVDHSCIDVTTTLFPLTSGGLTLNHVSHGGQLGAPFSQMDCGAILGNKCIRGQWQHSRHYTGQGDPREIIDVDFHSVTPKGVFDSLSCACLGCCDPATGAFIPPTTGPLIHKFALCNPDDHKVCGPQPRPAPANAIIFSGLGRLTVTNAAGGNKKAVEWVVFRVYIEDRSEPGGFHPKGSVEPADIYCFQAWKTGIAVNKKPDFCAVEADFRTCLGADNCAFLGSLESGASPIGTLPSATVCGRTADINDCGALRNGNQQIHPSTSATCDAPGGCPPPR